MIEHPDQQEELELTLANPPRFVIEAVKRLPGDFVILGVGGKMGTTTALMLRQALDEAGRKHATVTGVSRFSRADARDKLERFGIRTVACDLSEPIQIASLAHVENVLFLAGQKFGTEGAPERTWVQNTLVPAFVARQFRSSRIVAFSSGCVYPFSPVDGPGCHESEPPAFLGEYASSCVARERIFTHYAHTFRTRLLIFRLNYAVERRYGVLVDIALKVWQGEPVDVTMGWLNCIWQGDACARAIACLEHATNPPRILNVTGPEKLSVRQLAREFGRLLGRDPILAGREADSAWLADASEAQRLFGPPETPVHAMLQEVAAHVRSGRPVLGLPTHFEQRDGKF